MEEFNSKILEYRKRTRSACEFLRTIPDKEYNDSVAEKIAQIQTFIEENARNAVRRFYLNYWRVKCTIYISNILPVYESNISRKAIEIELVGSNRTWNDICNFFADCYDLLWRDEDEMCFSILNKK